MIKEIEVMGIYDDGEVIGNCSTTIKLTIEDESVRIPLKEFLKLTTEDRCKYLYNPDEKNNSI